MELDKIRISDVPWQRLTTPYGRGTELPALLAERRYPEIANLIEHQSTLWQVTPWVLLFLLRELDSREPEQVETEEIRLYAAVAASVGDAGEGEPVPAMSDLLDARYWWPESEEDDDGGWEEGEPPGYDQTAFYSYYAYSGRLLVQALPLFRTIRKGQETLAAEIDGLIESLEALKGE
ncbi:hypothetical protein WMW72_01385 [Paenibacillus filicis]|uniref:Uncharacterized protein n=1 Tax=Paenibacillus filicis TaxID=669464 RepID=A0ABU9DEU2_9BACL